jgi:hypothetical protein
MDKITKLKELKQLLDDGLLTQEEFDTFKSGLISGSTENKNNDSKSTETVVEEDKTAKIQTEKKYIKELNSSQTNHSYWRFILAIAFFLGGGYYIFYHFALKNSNNDEQKTESQEGIDGSQNNSESSTILEVSKKFIGQTYSHTSNSSFGYETITFSFEENGRGTFVQSHLTQVPLEIQRKYNRYSNSRRHKDSGNIFWRITKGKIQVDYIYKSSDGVSSDAKEVLVFDENRNVLLDDNDNTTIYKPVQLTRYDNNESLAFDEAEYNRQQEQAEYESSQAYYNSKEYKESVRESEPKKAKVEEAEIL